jgi:hypothetical protein
MQHAFDMPSVGAESILSTELSSLTGLIAIKKQRLKKKLT